jgi:hypothetical protein
MASSKRGGLDFAQREDDQIDRSIVRGLEQSGFFSSLYRAK